MHINEILINGEKLKAVKLEGKEVDRLIEIIIKEQEKILALKKIDYKLLEQRITI